MHKTNKTKLSICRINAGTPDSLLWGFCCNRNFLINKDHGWWHWDLYSQGLNVFLHAKHADCFYLKTFIHFYGFLSILCHHFFSKFWRMSIFEDIWTCVCTCTRITKKVLILTSTSATFLSALHMCICRTWMFLCVRLSQRLFLPQLLKLWSWHNLNFLCPLQNTGKRNSLLTLWETESWVSCWGFDHVFSVVVKSCFSGFQRVLRCH